MLTTVLIFIIILGLLVFVHEFGHFIVAKKSGMRVLECGFGFPPRLFGFQKVSGKWRVIIGHRGSSQPLTSPPTPLHEMEEARAQEGTIYSVNSIPLGGFVKIWGENNEHEGDPQSFINKPFGKRFATLVAGVAMNVILTWVLISIGFMVGMPTAIDDTSTLPQAARFTDRQPAIIEILPNSPAEKAGLLPGDAILQINGQSFSSIEQIRDYIRANAGQVFEFKLKRAGEED